MEKKIIFTSTGSRADIGDIRINRIIANEHIDAVGPFVFLDHALPTKHSPDVPPKKANGSGAHPHRGIATLTYMLSGEAEHLDSKGHYAKVHAGGVQWMKAGNGIIHDEVTNIDPESSDHYIHALQFWINLPAKQKAENPEYLSVEGSDIPKKSLSNNNGWVKVIAGKLDDLISPIPSYSKQFLYHIHLEGCKQFYFPTAPDLEYAAFLPLNGVTINNTRYRTGDFLMFEKSNGTIRIDNPSGVPSDILLFGGECYNEPIVTQGPFVMNTQKEITQAYSDFFLGKYGQIDYSVVSEGQTVAKRKNVL